MIRRLWEELKKFAQGAVAKALVIVLMSPAMLEGCWAIWDGRSETLLARGVQDQLGRGGEVAASESGEPAPPEPPTLEPAVTHPSAKTPTAVVAVPPGPAPSPPPPRQPMVRLRDML